MRKICIALLLCFPAIGASSQNSLLWEVSGNGLKSPSYLFGTYHLLTSTFIDSFPVIHQKYETTKAVAGEMVIDQAVMQKVTMASLMPDSTLDQLMSAEDYKLVADYLKESNGMDLGLFKNIKPVVISTLFYSALIPKDDKGTEMDIYFQQTGTTDGKKVIGLETIDDQIAVLFNGSSLKRQAELLVKMTKEKDKNKEEMWKMNGCYRQGNMDCLQEGMKDGEGYSAEEMKKLLFDRNNNWMKKIPGLMHEAPVFIAVGAGHLPGDGGLIDLLRKKGYTVKAIPMSK